MSRKQIIGYGVLATVVLFVIIYISSVFGYRSDCVNFEQMIPAKYDDNRNQYDNGWKRLKEMTQVKDMYAEDLRKIFDDTMKNRYGKDGTKAMFQFIQEHNPTLAPEVYTKIQAAIEAWRISFAADQKELRDMKAQYGMVRNGTRAVFVGFWFSFPHIDLNKYDIVTSDATEAAFATKRTDEIKLH